MGTSLTLRILQASRQDHPHAYGDKIITARIPAGIIGSSPRVWGQVYTFHNNSYLAEDHPHAYGDKRYNNDSEIGSGGSSPRVWGQAGVFLILTVSQRIIPTRMGTSPRLYTLILCHQDHPHAYGDKGNTAQRSYRCMGSSPRVWGQEAIGLSVPERRRIIPTRMGTR